MCMCVQDCTKIRCAVSLFHADIILFCACAGLYGPRCGALRCADAILLCACVCRIVPKMRCAVPCGRNFVLCVCRIVPKMRCTALCGHYFALYLCVQYCTQHALCGRNFVLCVCKVVPTMRCTAPCGRHFVLCVCRIVHKMRCAAPCGRNFVVVSVLSALTNDSMSFGRRRKNAKRSRRRHLSDSEESYTRGHKRLRFDPEASDDDRSTSFGCQYLRCVTD